MAEKKKINMEYLQRMFLQQTSDSNILVSCQVLFLCNYHDMIGPISQNFLCWVMSIIVKTAIIQTYCFLLVLFYHFLLKHPKCHVDMKNWEQLSKPADTYVICNMTHKSCGKLIATSF